MNVSKLTSAEKLPLQSWVSGFKGNLNIDTYSLWYIMAPHAKRVLNISVFVYPSSPSPCYLKEIGNQEQILATSCNFSLHFPFTTLLSLGCSAQVHGFKMATDWGWEFCQLLTETNLITHPSALTRQNSNYKLPPKHPSWTLEYAASRSLLPAHIH